MPIAVIILAAGQGSRMKSDLPEPDDETIRAWLDGELSSDETKAVDRYFEENPNAVPD